MELAADIFFWVTTLSISIQLLGAVCLVAFYFHKAPPLRRRREGYPKVTLVKCCYSDKDNEIENFDIFFHQDYPGELELIFTVPDETVPAAPIIQSYLQKYPNKNARMLVSKTRKSFWKKIDALYDGYTSSQSDVVVFSDSDSVVHKDYISEVVASLEEPGTSVVTIPQYDIRVNTFGSALKVVGNTCDLATFVMIAWAFTKNPKFGWGHSMAFWRKDFEALGPSEKSWAFINHFLADDIAIPFLFVQAGKQVRFRNIYCPVEYSNKTVLQSVDQKRRWVWCQRISVPNRYLYLLGTMVYPINPATLAVLFSGFAPWSLGLWAAAVGSRLSVSVLHEALFERTLKMNFRYWWTLMLWDWMQVFFVIEGFFRKKINFEGKNYEIVNRYFVKQVTAK